MIFAIPTQISQWDQGRLYCRGLDGATHQDNDYNAIVQSRLRVSPYRKRCSSLHSSVQSSSSRFLVDASPWSPRHDAVFRVFAPLVVLRLALSPARWLATAEKRTVNFHSRVHLGQPVAVTTRLHHAVILSLAVSDVFQVRSLWVSFLLFPFILFFPIQQV